MSIPTALMKVKAAHALQIKKTTCDPAGYSKTDIRLENLGFP